ncbi:leucine-rich repeat-containing protein 15-like [Mercenaria mercenaria]|uniref:leucine-rich repeat-containing protein 15-like n=1 Tax=Mercenaria mercenaria TaxID=6596 RepID=UPI00234F99D4|nr:leucine-rich repeat-containing protein 15-like [Mercenaria mercenaria]
MEGRKENIHKNPFRLVLILLALQQWYVGTTKAFLLTGTCPVRQPCQCGGETIDCSGMGLITIPHFYQTTLQAPFIRISLASNFLGTIPANSLQNLASLKGSFIYLDLNNNLILYIDDNAFSGIENMIGSLDLNDNVLQTLPKALAKLQSLQFLFILGNPLSSLDATVISRISGSLKRFEFSGRDFDQFPTEINLLTSLDRLMIDGTNVPINDNAFDGLKQTLKTLEFRSSMLPAAVCKLQVLEHLIWKEGGEGDDVSFNEKRVSVYAAEESGDSNKRFLQCNNTMPSVTHLTIIENDALLGDIFTVFPSLLYLRMEQNYLRFIDNRYIPIDAMLQTLYLDSSGFSNIPGALNVLVNLKQLSLADNRIEAITSYDVTGLTRLEILDLTGNPLRYIATDSFARNVNLHVLILDNTNLAAIPAAVTSLPSLSTLHLNNIYTLDCDCSTLSNVTSWNVDAITFPSSCYQNANTTIKAFIKDAVPKCP